MRPNQQPFPKVRNTQSVNEQAVPPSMQQAGSEWDARLQQAARAFVYPPTPDIASAAPWRGGRWLAGGELRPHGRRLAWAASIGVLIVVLALAAPGVRATLLETLGLGASLTWQAKSTPALVTPTMTITGLPSPGASFTATPQPLSTPLSLLDRPAGRQLQQSPSPAHHTAAPAPRPPGAAGAASFQNPLTAVIFSGKP